MKLARSMIVLLSFVWLNHDSTLRAEDKGERHEVRAPERHEAREPERHEVRQEAHPRTFAPRPEPPRFQPHPPGQHPHGPMVRGHAVRVMRPSVAKFGAHPWHHWEHGELTRPIYYWDWVAIHQVTCVAEDSYGDQYPVTEETFRGFGLVNMSAVEDDALDRCYVESGNDPSCYLATCSHF
jgi:hypothetical protein